MRDGNLVTGQQNFSPLETADVLVRALGLGLGAGVLALSSYRVEGEPWATVRRPVKIRARFWNKGAAALAAVVSVAMAAAVAAARGGGASPAGNSLALRGRAEYPGRRSEPTWRVVPCSCCAPISF